MGAVKPGILILFILLFSSTALAQRTVVGESTTILGVKRAVNFNSTADQAVPISPLKYIIRRVVVTNASVSLTTAAGGVYTAVSKGGTTLVAASQVYSSLTASGKFLDLTLTSDATSSTFTSETVYLSLTTAQGAAATADIYIIGDALPIMTSTVPVTITDPKPLSVIQRVGSSGTISIKGSVSGPVDIEAKFGNAEWSQIGDDVNGSFTLSLTNQPIGQGALEVRSIGTLGPGTIIGPISIGDVFIIAGQSNASGRGDNLQLYSSTTFRSFLFGNDYLWKELVDQTDSGTAQADNVSLDASPGGSVWPLVAGDYVAATSIPVAFIPCALGGSSITQWLPGMNHQDRATLYGSMIFRALSVGGCKAVLWWQGETDALAGMSTATYQTHLANLAAAVMADLGVKILPCKLQNSSAITDSAEAQINTAIANLWAGDPNVGTGPDLSDLASDDGFHLKTNSKLSAAAGRWSSALVGL